ncbi:MAG: hypothetical protein WAN44_04295, partial [Propionibacteriaceae bacterium]
QQQRAACQRVFVHRSSSLASGASNTSVAQNRGLSRGVVKGQEKTARLVQCGTQHQEGLRHTPHTSTGRFGWGAAFNWLDTLLKRTD